MDTKARFEALERKIERLSTMREVTINKNYRELLRSLEYSLSELYKKYEINGQLTFDEMSKYDRLSKLDDEVGKLITGLYSTNSKLIRVTLQDIYKTTFGDVLDIATGASGRKIRAISRVKDVAKVVNQEMAGLVWSDRLAKGRADFIYNLQATIKEGLSNGDTYGTMAKKLKDTVEGDVVKPIRIVRTEGHRVNMRARTDVLDKADSQGIKMWKIWRSVGDERVRRDHKSIDGQRVPYSEKFTLPGGVKAEAPGLSGVKEQDINCRCYYRVSFIDE